MTRGFHLKFHTPPALSFSPPSRTLIRESQLSILGPFIPEFISRHIYIIRTIFTPQLLFSSLFARPKEDQSFRPIILISSKTLLIIPSFKLETIALIAKGLLTPLWGCTMDLSDAYFHVPIHWAFHRFFAFMIDGRIFVFQFLPFGLSPAPWAFSKLIKTIMSPPLASHSNSLLSKRFLNPSNGSVPSQESHSSCPSLFPKARFHNKFQEIMSNSFTGSRVLGSHASSGFTTTKSPPYKSRRHCKQMQGSSTKTSQLPQGVGKSDRLVEFYCSASSTRPSLPAASDRLDEQKFLTHLEGSTVPDSAVCVRLVNCIKKTTLHLNI